MAFTAEQVTIMQAAIKGEIDRNSMTIGNLFQTASEKVAEIDQMKDSMIVEIDSQRVRIDERIVEMNALKLELSQQQLLVDAQTENLNGRL